MKNLLAQALTLPDNTKLVYPNEFQDFQTRFPSLGSILTMALRFIFAFAGIGLLLMILSSGFTLLTSGGDPKKLEMGRNRITNAIVGFVIIFVAFWLTQLMGIIFGIAEIGTIFK